MDRLVDLSYEQEEKHSAYRISYATWSGSGASLFFPEHPYDPSS
jgi:hypothetical protein